MKKDAYYFSHDSNARNDEKLIAVRMKLGMEGYGIFFAIIERLRESTNYMSVKNYNIIAFDLRVGAEKIKSVVEDFGLFIFTDNGKHFYSKSLSKRMDFKESKSEKARRAANKRWQNKKTQTLHNEKSNANALHTQSERNALKESKVKESKVKEREKEKKKENAARAFDFLKNEFPSRFETNFQMRYSSKIKNKKKFVEDFNDTVDQEDLDYTAKKLFARLGKYARNWIENQSKYKKQTDGDMSIGKPKQEFK